MGRESREAAPLEGALRSDLDVEDVCVAGGLAAGNSVDNQWRKTLRRLLGAFEAHSGLAYAPAHYWPKIV